MKKCDYCNANIEENATKCDFCGMDIPAEQSAEQPAAQAQPQTIADIKPTIKSTPVVKRRRKNSWWSITLSVLLSICLFFTLFVGVSFTLVRHASSGGMFKAVVKEVNVFDIPVTADGGTVADLMADTINGMLTGGQQGTEESEAEESPVAQSTGGIVLCSATSGEMSDIEDMLGVGEIGGAFEGTGEIDLGSLGIDLSELGNIEGLQGILGDIEFDGQLNGEQIKELAQELGLADVLSEIMTEVGGALTGNEINLTSAQILGSVKENKAVIEEKLGITITDEQFKQVEEVLDRELVNVNKTLNEQVSKVTEQPAVQTAVKTVSFVVGPTIPIVAYAVSGFLVLLILLMLRRKETTFMFAGIPTLLVGLTLLVMFLCSDIIADFGMAFISNALGSAAQTYTSLIQTVIKAVINPMLTASLITMGAGVVCVILYIVLRAAIGKSKKYAK